MARVHYSESLPKGKGKDLSYDKDMYKLMNRLVYDMAGRTQATTDSAQVALAEIGYLDPEDVDSHLGDKTLGAATRYLQNYNRESVWERIKEMGKNLFD